MSIPLLLIFGESPNDAKALRHLIPALLPTGFRVDCKPIREPGTLSRNAGRKKRGQLAKAIAIKAAAESRRRPVAVVVHEDSDACEDAHADQAAQILTELRRVGIDNPVAAVAAWEIETWWMLFPEALRVYRTCWSPVDYSSRNVGLIEQSKEVLTRDLRPKGPLRAKCPDYAESDSERIAQEVFKLRLCDDQRVERSNSLRAFRAALTSALRLS